MKQKYDEPHSDFAFDFNMRRYAMASANPQYGRGCAGEYHVFDAAREGLMTGGGVGAKVGRCRLTVSKPVLKAPMVSALETTIS